MLIVPYGWDQPDNAARVERLGVGLHVARGDYSVDTATAALKSLLESSCFSARAAEVGDLVAAEDGLTSTSACNARFGLLDSSILFLEVPLNLACEHGMFRPVAFTARSRGSEFRAGFHFHRQNACQDERSTGNCRRG